MSVGIVHSYHFPFLIFTADTEQLKLRHKSADCLLEYTLYYVSNTHEALS